MVYKLGQETRNKLKSPFGALITGTSRQAMAEVKRLIETTNPPAVISVGDMVSTNLFSKGIVTLLSITDNKCMRKEMDTGVFPGRTVTYVKNPAGTITQEAMEKIKKALQSSIVTQIIVEGEEDLLSLIAIKYAQENTLVIYGQPNEGMVVVKASREKKAEVETILEEMKTVRKAK
jgi:GTP-dependent dephospho-CoA kinase